MRPIAIAGVLIGTMLLFQTALALPGYLPANRREQNKQVLLAQEGIDWNPGADAWVYAGPPGSTLPVKMTASAALEKELDFLEAQGVSLAKLVSTRPSSTTSGDTGSTSSNNESFPNPGKFKFWEDGYYTKHARCPQVAKIFPTAVDPVFRQIIGFNDTRVGVMETNISYATKGGLPESALFYYNATDDGQAPGQTPAKSWWYTGWKLRAVGAMDYWCKEGASGHVRNHTYFIGNVTRIATR